MVTYSYSNVFRYLVPQQKTYRQFIHYCIYTLFRLFSTKATVNLRQFVFPGLKGLGIISKVRQCGYWTNSLFRLEAPCGKPLDRKSTSTALEPKDGDCSPSLSRPTTGSTPCAHRKWKIQHYTFSNIEPIRIRLPDNFQSRQNQTIDNLTPSQHSPSEVNASIDIMMKNTPSS